MLFHSFMKLNYRIRIIMDEDLKGCFDKLWQIVWALGVIIFLVGSCIGHLLPPD